MVSKESLSKATTCVMDNDCDVRVMDNDCDVGVMVRNHSELKDLL